MQTHVAIWFWLLNPQGKCQEHAAAFCSRQQQKSVASRCQWHCFSMHVRRYIVHESLCCKCVYEVVHMRADNETHCGMNFSVLLVAQTAASIEAAFMAPRRGPGSRVHGPAKRVSKKGKEEVKAQKQAKTQQALKLTKATGDSKQVAVSRVKSASSTGSENLAAINQEALLELNEHLLANPHKILVLLRMAKKEEYFKEASTLPGDWLHSTLIYVKEACLCIVHANIS